MRRLINRIHHLMNLPPDHGEELQVAHYLPGQSYGFHADAFDGAPRAYTFLAFLNTPSFLFYLRMAAVDRWTLPRSRATEKPSPSCYPLHAHAAVDADRR